MVAIRQHQYPPIRHLCAVDLKSCSQSRVLVGGGRLAFLDKGRGRDTQRNRELSRDLGLGWRSTADATGQHDARCATFPPSSDRVANPPRQGGRSLTVRAHSAPWHHDRVPGASGNRPSPVGIQKEGGQQPKYWNSGQGAQYERHSNKAVKLPPATASSSQ
jgi:hypothetical protein